MPVKGRRRKAKPRQVFDSFPDNGLRPAKWLRPRADETFAQYLVRIDCPGYVDPVFIMAIKEGYGTGDPQQQEYLQRLTDVIDTLYELREKLNRAWPNT